MVAANTLGTRGGAYGTAGRASAEGRLADLRQKLREALAQKQLRMKEFVETCKADRRAVRDHVREMRARSLRDLKDQIQAARGAAKLTRLTRLAEVRQVAGGPVQQARAAAAVERAHQGELARLEREERSRRIEIRLAHDRSLAAGSLRSAIFGKLAPLFERSVAPAPGESRAEAILRFAERNPEKAHAVVEPAVHRKVEETKRAVVEAERSVRAAGGDVRVGTRPSSTETRDRRDRQQRAAAQGAWPLPGEQRIGPTSTSVGRGSDGEKGPSNDNTTLKRARAAAAAMGTLGDVLREGASERVKAGAGSDGIAGNVMAAIARDAEGGGKAPRKGASPGKIKAPKPPKATAPKRPKSTKTPKAPKPVAAKPSAPVERKKGQIPRSGGPGIGLADLLQERDEIVAAKSAKTKGARDKRGPAKKVAANESSSAPPAPPPPGAGGSPSVSYAAWCELVSQAAAKHGGRIAFGVETHDAWRDGTSAEAFVLTQPTTTQASPAAIIRDARSSRVAASGGARAPLTMVKGGKAPGAASSESATKGPVLVTSKVEDRVQPFKVRASCGHVEVRPMRAATAGVPYSPDVILDAPKGRACEACEARQKQKAAAPPGTKPDFGANAPDPGPKRDDVKAPELRDTAEIAKRIRADIADAVRTKKLPKGTYSVRTSKYSMGSSIDVIASKLPFPLLNPAAFRLEKGSSDVSFNRDSFSTRYTAQAESVLATLNAIVGAYHWDRSDPVTDYYNERFGRDVKLDTSKEWERINEAKRAEARAPSTPASTTVSGGAAPAVLPSPRRIEAPKPEKPETTKGRVRAGRPKAKVQQTLDTDSPLFAGAPRFVGAPAAAAEGPTKSEESTKSEEGGSEP